MKKSGVFLLLLLSYSFCVPRVLYAGGITLSDAQVQTIRSELQNMRQEVTMLKTLQQASETGSKEFQEKCTELEAKLTKASQALENSELSVIELQQTVKSLQAQLDGLRTEYRELNQSLTRQKKLTQVLTVTAIVSILAALTEGAVLVIRK